MRPPAAWLFSKTVTRWPACASVRAQAMPAMPAPITAMWRCGRCKGELEEREEGAASEEVVRDFFAMSWYFFSVDERWADYLKTH